MTPSNNSKVIMKRILFFNLILFVATACAQEPEVESTEQVPLNEEVVEFNPLGELQTAYFASGCFWCVEAIYESVEGVAEAVSGYAGGDEKNPTYAEVSSGRTNHAEAVMVYYDSTRVNFETLVDVFFESHDPSTLNRQGPDSGTQYRSIAFYQNEREKEIIEEKILTLLTEKTYSRITTEVIPFEEFYEAEEYHQNYEELNPDNPYVRSVSKPRLNRFKEKMPKVLKHAD